jgi:hypothetical protein
MSFTFKTRVKPEWIADGGGSVYGGDTSWTSNIREVTGEGSIKASINSDSAGVLYIEGTMRPAVGPWIVLYSMATVLDVATGLYVADISIPVPGRRYIRIRYDAGASPIGVNFDVQAYMVPV